MMSEESIDLRLGLQEAQAEIAELLTRYAFLFDDRARSDVSCRSGFQEAA